MKLIKKGTNLEEKYQATCKNCGSVWEAEKKELRISFERNERCIQTETCGECGTYGLNFRPKSEC